MPRFSISSLNNKYVLALSGNVAISVLGIMQWGLLYRSLDKYDVGLWIFFMMVYSLADALRNGLLSTATVKFYAGAEPARAATVLGSVWFLAIAITGSLCVLDVACFPFMHHFSSPEITVTIKWFGITVLSSLVFTVVLWILVADEKYGKILWLRLVNSGSMVMLIIALIFMKKMSLEALLFVNVITYCLASLVGLLWGLAKVKTLFKKSNECIFEIIHFGKYSLGSSLLSRCLASTDTFIITFILGPAALAIYSIPLRLMEFIELPLRSFVGIGMSSMAAALNNKNMERVIYIFKKYSGMVTYAFIPLIIGTFIFADLAVSILGGGKYIGTEAANIYRIFMTFAILYPIDRFNGVTLDIIHQPKINFYKVIIMLVINVGADFAGLAIYRNIYSVAIASFFTLAGGLLYGHIQLRKHIQYTIRDILSTGYLETKLFIRKKVLKQN
jgi:O-antigen/teichoic acid export membrane protein